MEIMRDDNFNSNEMRTLLIKYLKINSPEVSGWKDIISVKAKM